MTDHRPTDGPGQESKTNSRRCQEIFRTERGWERCHLDEHEAGTRHHVRDRSWVTVNNTPRLRLGQPCGQGCTWPDLVISYRSGTGRRTA